MRHPAEFASDISHMPPEHQACLKALYDSICEYSPEESYEGDVVVYEATAEPDRSVERIAKKWARISKSPTIVPIDGSHMSIVNRPDGLALAGDLSERLRDLAGSS